MPEVPRDESLAYKQSLGMNWMLVVLKMADSQLVTTSNSKREAGMHWQGDPVLQTGRSGGIFLLSMWLWCGRWEDPSNISLTYTVAKEYCKLSLLLHQCISEAPLGSHFYILPACMCANTLPPKIQSPCALWSVFSGS